MHRTTPTEAGCGHIRGQQVEVGKWSPNRGRAQPRPGFSLRPAIFRAVPHARRGHLRGMKIFIALPIAIGIGAGPGAGPWTVTPPVYRRWGAGTNPAAGYKKGDRVFNARTTADKSAAIWDRRNASHRAAPLCRPQGFESAYSRRFTGGGIRVRTRPRDVL